VGWTDFRGERSAGRLFAGHRSPPLPGWTDIPQGKAGWPMQNDAFPSDDLSELERRLSGWQPSGADLDADAMLFAAGQGSRQGLARARRLWAALACTMTVLCMGLAAWLVVERTQRQHLESML